jgi:hypothetical protein
LERDAATLWKIGAGLFGGDIAGPVVVPQLRLNADPPVVAEAHG